MKPQKPQRDYHTVESLAQQWGWEESDVLHEILTGRLHVSNGAIAGIKPEFFRILADEVTRYEKTSGSFKDSPQATNSLLKMVIAMAIDGYGYDPKQSKSPTPQEIVEAVEKRGLSIEADTVRKWLKEGAKLLPSDL